MAKLDMSKLELSKSQLGRFQLYFNDLYMQFEKHAVLKASARGGHWNEEGWLNDYATVKRIATNLNLHGFVKVFMRMPKRDPTKKYENEDDRPHSYIEIFPTEKGKVSYANGDFCPIISVWLGWEYKETETGYRGQVDVRSPPKVGIGKGYPGEDTLENKYFKSAYTKYHVAMSRQWDWFKEFQTLYLQKLIILKEEEAAVEIEALIQRLVPTLPRRRSQSRKREAIEKSAQLQSF